VRPSLEGCDPVLRMGTSSSSKADGDNIAVTDNGNYIVDMHFKTPILDVVAAASDLKNSVGVVEHGLFVGMSYQAGPVRWVQCLRARWTVVGKP
jgi:ribose 5-phosphate isomerase A